jgi:hypothetical protein
MLSFRRMVIPIALLATIALAACANQAGIRVGGPAVELPHSPTAATSEGATTNRDAARREATRILATFKPPAGAHRLAARPAGATLLDKPLSTFGTPDTADDTSWWATTGDPQSVVLGFVPPAGAIAGDSSNDGGPGGVAYGVTFDWPPIPGVLDSRDLQVAAQRVGNATILRVDGMVSWVPSRPATVTSVTVTYTPGNLGQQMAGTRSYGPVTVTDPGEVTALVKAINTEQMQQPGARPCPFAGGGHMNLALNGTAGLLATTAINTDGCGNVTVDVTGGTTATLAGGPDLGNAIESIAHLPWPPVT